MLDRLEQLLQIKQLCLAELKQAHINCEHFSAVISALGEKLKENWPDINNCLIEYDSLVTNITDIMNATRVFNLNLHLYDLKLSEIQNDFLKFIQKSKLQDASGEDTQIKTETVCHFYPAEEIDYNLESIEDFTYPTIDLREIYKPNDIITGTVTYIKNLKDLNFYIFDNSCNYKDEVVELSKTLELRQYESVPPTSEVFGCVLDNQIFRAVRGSKTYYDEEMKENIFPCYLLDTGEVLPLKFDNIMYKLTNNQKNIPALALPCQVKLNKNPFLTREMVENKLSAIEYQKCQLKLLTIENNTLHVEIVAEPKSIGNENDIGTRAIENITSEAVSTKTKENQLTEEELDILYEEPLCTSNAMKAVMGYDPQDDKRICRFYNPSTGGCFKGVNCKLEHTLRQADGWTKDILPTASVMDNHPITLFPADTIINITPTYVGQLDRFFAQINDPHKTITPLLWNDEDVPSWKRLQKPPHIFEIVLSRYFDGLWYRAKILSHDDEYKMFKVFYVDYGNVQIVNLRNLASIDISIAQLPFQATLCRLDGVNEKPSVADEERKNSVEILCDMILNKTMDVKVISHYEDLFISFVDKKAYPLPDVLIEMGYLQQNKSKILI